MTEDFKFIDNEDVPPSIKPMTELHDKLVKGYISDKELQLPRLISSLEKRICKQVEAMVDIEGQVQLSNSKLVSCLQLLKKLIFHKDISDELSDEIIEEVEKIHKYILV